MRRAKAMLRGLARRGRALVFGEGAGILDRVRAVRARWRHRA